MYATIAVILPEQARNRQRWVSDRRVVISSAKSQQHAKGVASDTRDMEEAGVLIRLAQVLVGVVSADDGCVLTCPPGWWGRLILEVTKPHWTLWLLEIKLTYGLHSKTVVSYTPGVLPPIQKRKSKGPDLFVLWWRSTSANVQSCFSFPVSFQEHRHMLT